MSYPVVTREAVARAYKDATEARINLTAYRCGNIDDMHVMKVCSVCDRFITSDSEAFVKIDDFEEKHREHFHQDMIEDPYGLEPHVMRNLNEYYTQEHFADEEESWLNNMILSPRSHGSDPRDTKQPKKLGCCKECKNGLKNATRRKNQNGHPCRFAMANGLMIGTAPKCIEDLNDVEIALVSKGRCEKHIFSYSAGAHTQIRGFHTIYQNDVQHTNAVLNCMEQRSAPNLTRVEDGEESGGEIDHNEELDTLNDDIFAGDHYDENSDTDDSSENHYYENSDSDDNAFDESDVQNEDDPTKRPICVILAGPFTAAQVALTKLRTAINRPAMRTAMNWLTNNNIICGSNDCDDRVVEPHYVYCHRLEDSSGSNIEVVFDINAVFPNSSEITPNNGGFKTIEEFKKHTLGTVLSPSTETSETLISRASRDKLRDYEGDNLMKAFVKQFPYGTGHLDGEGDHRGGTAYLQHLLLLSNPNLHTPAFVLIVHNMFEKSRLVSASCIRVADADKKLIGELDNESMAAAMEEDTHSMPEDSPAAMFLRKLRAVTGSVATSVQASKLARKNMLSMIVRYGSPAVFFTLSPNDLFNFRILTMASKNHGCKDPPSSRARTSSLKQFATKCAETRTACPSICALDFENVIQTTIKHLLGWDITHRKNMPNAGLFGDLDGYTFATEEQGRKTLHAHFLIWLKDWSNVLDGLGEIPVRDFYSNVLKNHSSMIKSNALHKGMNIVCPCGSSLTNNAKKCSDQDIRNLRSEFGVTSIGGGAILECFNSNCQKKYTGNELATVAVDNILNCQNTLSPTDDQIFDINGLWFRNSMNSKRQVLLELKIMRNFVKQKRDYYKNNSKTIQNMESRRCSDNLFLINSLRNLHSSDHSPSCFKKSKSHECRMRIPNRGCQESNTQFEVDSKKWFTWKGEQKSRNLFVFEGERSHEDCFVNTSHPVVSMVFGSNSNVTHAVDGGSVMYITLCASKDTQKDDRKSHADAARIMVNKLNEKIDTLDNGSSTNDDTPTLGNRDPIVAGMKALIGASFIATSSRICSSTMAAYLTRNHSRFQFSHRFASIAYQDFDRNEINNLSIDSTEDGLPFFKSSVLDYMHRPVFLEQVCLYDFVSECHVQKKKKDIKSSPWSTDHPSRKHLIVTKKKANLCLVPRLTFWMLPDTKHFGGHTINNCKMTVCSESEQCTLEKYAKVASLLFVPFREKNSLTDENDCYLLKFQQFLSNPPPKFVELHANLLKNIQDCHNSFNCGRPKDALERVTSKPEGNAVMEKADDENANHHLIDMMDCLVNHGFQHQLMPNMRFRSENAMFSMKTAYTTELGRHKCGTTLCRPPTVDTMSSVFLDTQMSTLDLSMRVVHRPFNKSDKEKSHDREKLFELSQRCTESLRSTIGQISTNVPVTGTLENIREYAEMAFKNDSCQCKAFELIVAAFIVELYNAPQCLGKRQRQKEAIVRKLKSVNHEGQFVAFLSGPGGTGKSRVIHTVLQCCKLLCDNAKIGFNKRTISKCM